MSDTQTESQKYSRVQVRLPEALTLQVKRRIDDEGLYNDPSDYVRDLIRKDALDQHETSKDLFHEYLALGMTADKSHFEQFTMDDVRKRANELYGELDD